MKQVQLKSGREKSLLRKHPWVFTGAVGKVTGSPGKGETVDIISAGGQLLGRGAWSPDSQMSVRMWSYDDVLIDEQFFRDKLSKALALRVPPIIADQTTGFRIIHAESDGLPGLTVDRYENYLVCQFTSAGAEYWKSTIVQILSELLPCKGIIERSDLAVRKKEGLKESTGLLWGQEPPEQVIINEDERLYSVNIRHGHKTGFYLDQRVNRTLVGNHSAGMEVLDCFSYTGGFAVAAATGGAAFVTLLDSSGPSLAQAKQNMELNQIPPEKFELVEGDVFQMLRRYRSEKRTFNLILLDPPKFVESRNSLEKGARAYKDINMIAMQLLRPGGFLFTFSCSGHMEDLLFQKIVSDAALDAGKDLKIYRWLAQGPDHPVSASFPEGKYLKGLMTGI